MKVRMIAIIFALATFSWAQNAASPKANPALPSTATAPAATKAEGSCCQKMGDGKAAESCCAHHADGSTKSETSCCKGKDGNAMSCMKGDKDKSAEACCSSGKCGGDMKEGCCSKTDKTTEQAAMACCGKNGEQCSKAQHDHADISK
jgi:hypothetical protein